MNEHAGRFPRPQEQREGRDGTAAAPSACTPSAPLHTRQLPPLVAAKNPDRIMRHVHMQRTAAAQSLIRHFIVQIRYGCTNKKCTTPQCFSSERRITDAPTRRPTPLTARALAHLLASSDDPLSYLCPHPLRIDPKDLDFGEHPATSDQGTLLGDTGAVLSTERELQGNTEVVSKSARSIWKRDLAQLKKDRKSLSQSLFDTMVMKDFELLSIDRKPRSSANGVVGVQAPNTPDSTPSALRNGNPAHIESSSEESKHRPLSIANDKSSNGTAVRVIQRGANSLGVSSADHVIKTLGNANEECGISTASSFKSLQSQAESEHEPTASHPIKTRGKETKTDTKSGDPFVKLDQANGTASELTQDKASSATSEMPVTITLPKRDIPGRIQISSTSKNDEKQTVRIFPWLSCVMFQRMKSKALDTEHWPETPGLHSIALLGPSDVFPRLDIIDQQIFYVLSDSKALCKSFRDVTWTRNEFDVGSRDLVTAFHNGLEAFQGWVNINGSLVYDSLWLAIEALFTRPPELAAPRSPRVSGSFSKTKREGGTSHNAEYLTDDDAAHIVMICLCALMAPMHQSLSLRFQSNDASAVRDQAKLDAHDKSQGSTSEQKLANLSVHQRLAALDPLMLSYEPAVRLAKRLLSALAIRKCHYEILRTMKPVQKKCSASSPTMLLIICYLRHLQQQGLESAENGNESERPLTWKIPGILQELIQQTLLLDWDWNGKGELKRWTSAGGALDVLDDLYHNREDLGLEDETFETLDLFSLFDEAEVPLDYISRIPNVNSVHVLDYRFLFDHATLIAFFRAVNLNSLNEGSRSSKYQAILNSRMDFALNESSKKHLKERLKTALNGFLYIDVRRGHLLEDAFNQVWGKERRELLRALRVKIGADSGEIGFDAGGISQEFFRLVFEEAFHPDTQLFVTDSRTQMTYFRPLSREPLYRFELLGLLVSLALYNGFVLPVTFPEAFYRRLLGESVTQLKHLKDGWPDIAKSMQQLLEWEDGDVEDVFTREYAFACEAGGLMATVDMTVVGRKEPWPSAGRSIDLASLERPGVYVQGIGEKPEWDIPMVTNANREKFVEDYIFWLTEKSVGPQFEAFAKGFYTCLDRRAVNLLPPHLLRNLTEGEQSIDIDELQRITQYDNITADHWLIQAFWRIVKSYDQTKKQRLLEFVTASDRVPVMGLQWVTFVIERNGPDSEYLPTSSTCFGRLLLPEYASEEKLAAKLDVALANTLGFGNM